MKGRNVSKRAVPEVTVVIPCHNDADVLERSVSSIRRDEVDGVQIIIVDDASTDDSVAVAEGLAEGRDDVAVLALPESLGPAGARNRGFALAKGPFICFLDSDDEHLAGFLGRCVEIMRGVPHVASVRTGMEFVGARRPIGPLQYEALVNSGPQNLVARRAVVEVLGGFPEADVYLGETAGEDIVFRTLLRDCFTQARIEDKLLRYHVKPGSHLEIFLERSHEDGDRLIFDNLVEEEANGGLEAESKRVLDAFAERVRACASSTLAIGEAPFFQLLSVGAGEVMHLHRALAAMDGAAAELNPVDGHILHFCAAFAPGDGETVVLGDEAGAVAPWLETGARRANKAPVRRFAYVDPPEAGPTRLLCAASGGGQAARDALALWLGTMPLGGLAAFHGGAGGLAEALDARPGAWRRALETEMLLVYERVGP